VLLIYMRYIEKISMDNSTAANASGVEAYSWGAFRSGMANLTLSSSFIDESSSFILSQNTGHSYVSAEHMPLLDVLSEDSTLPYRPGRAA
jgi:hypothetical protein